jgi:hypothetical protein
MKSSYQLGSCPHLENDIMKTRIGHHIRLRYYDVIINNAESRKRQMVLPQCKCLPNDIYQNK